MEKIKILGIAPYQEMEPLMRDIAKSYDIWSSIPLPASIKTPFSLQRRFRTRSLM